MKKKVFSLLMIFVMVLSLLPASVFADDLVTVTFNVAPSTVNVSFFADASAESAVDASAIKDNGVVKVGSYNYHQSVLTVAPGTYSYRGTDGDYVLGGEQFAVTKADTINLLRANIRYNGASLNQNGDYTFTLKNGDNDVVCGTPYLSSNILYTPTLLIAGVTHNGTVSLTEKWLDTFYLSGSGESKGGFSNTPSKTATSAANINLPITQYKIIKLTAPTAASTTFYKQDANYVVETVTPDSKTENEDGTTTYLFKSTAAHSGYQFRSMMSGKMTQAGYLADGNNIAVSFDDGDPYSTVSAMDYDDNSVLLNVKTGDKLVGQNKLNLNVGETFKLRAFRGAWEIINTTTGNQMIEPDFHYAILSGYDVVSITPTTECSNSKFPNAKNGNATDNWMNVKALKKGKAVVAVWYDAINVFNANPPAANDWAVFGAADPARYGVFVVSVGDDTGITWNPASHDGDWDAEFDVVYYNGDEGYFVFAPNEDVTNVTVQNVYGTTLSSAKCVSASADGSYSVPVTDGANIVAVTTADGTDYQIVRAKKINYTITNNTTGESKVNGAPTINTEDEVTISFDKLDMPVPKMSGIYNPGYLGTGKTAYVLNDSMLLTSKGTQYDFSINNSITFKAHIVGENSLKGYISLSSMGDPLGNHRGITDDGKPVNMNAGEVFGDFGVLPDIKFTVTDNGNKASYEEATKIEKFSVVAGLNTFNMAFNWNKAQDTEAAWNKTATQLSSFGLIPNVSAKDYNNIITFRYWYDGEKINSVQLKSGIATTIPNTEFALNPDKVLHLQVEIRPVDTSLGDPITYNYLAFPGNSSNALSYVHPFIKSLTAEADGETLVMKPMLNTVDTAYTLCVGDAKTITLSAVQVVGLYNTANTGDKSDKVVLTKMKVGSTFGDPVTVLESGLANNPNRAWTYPGLDITDADALKIVVTSYVDNTTARSYTFKLDRIAGSENGKKAQAVDALIDAIGEITLESETTITIAREAYDALTSDQKSLVTKLDVLTVAEATLEKLKNPPLPPIIIGGDDTVTFRLIGSTKSSEGVDLSKGVDGYNGAEYVTWIKTGRYTLEPGDTVGTLFARAMADAGLSYAGLESNYISSITAPKACGGYTLSEFDNGSNSGWMYTVNGKHPDCGLNDRKLSDGDAVIWHYVNDYAYEVSDWFGGSSGDSSIQNLWLKAADKNPSAAYDPEYRPAETKAEDKQEPDKTSEIEIAPVTPNDGKAEIIVESKDIKKTVEAAVKAEEFGKAEDKVDTIAIKTDIQGDAKQVKVSLPVESLKMIADKTNAGVDVQTPNGNVVMPSDALKEIVSQAGKENIEVKVENKAPEDVKENVVSKLADALKDAPAKADGSKFDEKLLDKATVVDIKISAGNKNITGFNGNSITVSVPVDTKKFAEGKYFRTFIQSENGEIEAKAAHIAGGNAEVETSHLSTFVITEEEVSPFIDIDIVNDWFAESATKAFEKKIINGVGGNVFDSKSTFTRAMIVQVLYNLEGKPATEYEMTFNDVAEDAWYADAVRWAQSTGIVGGYPDGRFDPNGAVTREQTALILMNYAKYKKLDVTKRNELNEYPDMSKISSWALDAVKWANALKLIIGSDNKLNPTGDWTRAEAVTILVRFIENVK